MYFDDMNTEIVSSKNFIYCLHHPSSSHVYVGQTFKGMQRPRSHFSASYLKSTKQTARSKWIVSMRERGCEPEIVILEECSSPNELDEAERFHISAMRALGFELLNHTDGGGGIRGYRHTEECKRKQSERVRKLVAADPDYGKKRTEALNRLYADPAYRARVNEANKRKVAADPDYSAKMSKVSLSQWTDEAREAKSIAMLGNKRSATPEARAAASAANKGRPKSSEHRAKLSEAKRRLWENPEYRARQIAAQKAFHRRPENRAKAAEWAKLASTNTPKRREMLQELHARQQARLRDED